MNRLEQIIVTRVHQLREVLRSKWGVRLAFATWCVWLSFPYWCLGPNSYVQIHDNADQMFSALVGYSQGVSSLTLWAAAWATGADWLSQGYTNNLYTVLFLFLPPWMAYALFMFIQRFVAGYFTYRVLDNLGGETVACWYGGLAYSLFFSPGFTLFKGLTDAGFPLVVWAVTRKTTSASSLYIISFVIGVIYALTSSFHLSLFAFVLLTIWILAFDVKTQKRSWIAVAVLFLGWLLAEMPAIAAAAMNAGRSQRSEWNTVSIGGLRGAVQDVTGALTDNFLSLVILALAFAVTQLSGKFSRWLLVVLTCAAAPLLWYAVYARFHSKLGFLSGFTWARIDLLVPFLAISAAAIAGGALSQVRLGRIGLTFVMPVAVAFVLLHSLRLNASLLHAIVDGSNYTELYCNPDLLALAKAARSTPPYRVASVGIHPGFMWAYGFETADGYLNIYPKRYQKFWGTVIENSLDQDASLRSYFQNRGSRIYLYVPGQKESGELALLRDHTTSLRFADLFNLSLLSLDNVKYIVSTVPLDDPRLKLRPSTIRESQLEWRRKNKVTRYLDVLRGRSPGIPLYIYENEDVLPRFFCAKKVIAQRPDEILSNLSRLSSEDLLTVIFAGVPGPPADVAEEPGKIKTKSYSADCIALEVTSSKGCPLMVTNDYSPYWQALIDGRSEHVLVADYTFQGINVPPGSHEVRLQYSPPYAPRVCPR